MSERRLSIAYVTAADHVDQRTTDDEQKVFGIVAMAVGFFAHDTRSDMDRDT